MPIKKCKQDGKNGWKYGDSGKCYTGPGAKKKAIRQGLAEQYSGGPKFESRTKSDTELDRMADGLISRQEEIMDDVFRGILDKKLGAGEK